jgi:hypothetical protein
MISRDDRSFGPLAAETDDLGFGSRPVNPFGV